MGVGVGVGGESNNNFELIFLKFPNHNNGKGSRGKLTVFQSIK